MYLLKKHLCSLISLLVLISCSVPVYDQYEYELATSLKAEALILMDKAIDPAASHQAAINDMKLKLEKAYEYSAGRPNNEISAKQWEIIKDSEKNSLGGFLKRWEEKQTLSVTFITEVKGLVSDGFDTIIEYEGAKAE